MPTDENPEQVPSVYIGSIDDLPEIEVRTLEGPGGSSLVSEDDLRDSLEKKQYPANISEDIYLLHAVEVLREPQKDASGRQRGWYRVRVWLETETSDQLNACTRVIYRLHDTFGPSRRVIATEAKDRAFELEMRVYGEFNVIAYVERLGKPPIWLSRYLDLPGRPTD
jgi:hypothetical protein